MNDSSACTAQLYNGSEKTIIGFISDCQKPFKTQSTLQIPPQAAYQLQIQLVGQNVGEYAQTIHVQWADVAEMTQKAQT